MLENCISEFRNSASRHIYERISFAVATTRTRTTNRRPLLYKTMYKLHANAEPRIPENCFRSGSVKQISCRTDFCRFASTNRMKRCVLADGFYWKRFMIIGTQQTHLSISFCDGYNFGRVSWVKFCVLYFFFQTNLEESKVASWKDWRGCCGTFLVAQRKKRVSEWWIIIFCSFDQSQSYLLLLYRKTLLTYLHEAFMWWSVFLALNFALETNK